MSLTQPYQIYGYNPYTSVPYQIYTSQNMPSLQTYSYLYTNTPYSVSNTTLNQPPSLSSSKNQSSNTLFVKNLPFEMSSDEVKKMFGEYGEVAFIKSQVHDRGIAFVTFYDMRSAEKAYKKLHGTDFFGRHLVVDFSFKKNNHNNQNISLFVIIELLDFSQAMLINLDIVKKHMSSFGEIYNAYELSPYKYVIQFYDFRKSQNAARYGNTLVINGARCKIYIPEEDPILPTQPPQASTQIPVAASLPKTAETTVSLNPTVGNPYAAYQSTYNSYNYQQPQLQQQSVSQQVQPTYSTYQQPSQQVIQAPQVSIQNPQILSTQPQQIYTTQPQQVLQTQQPILQAQPQQIYTTQQQQILQTQPQQVIQTQPQQTFIQQPQQMIQTQPQQTFTQQPQQMIQTQPQQVIQTQQPQQIIQTQPQQTFTQQPQQMIQTQPQQVIQTQQQQTFTQQPQQTLTTKPQQALLAQNSPSMNQETKTIGSSNDSMKDSLKKLTLMMSQKSAF